MVITVLMPMLDEIPTESQKLKEIKIKIDNYHVLKNYLERKDVKTIKIKTKGGVKNG